MSEPGINLPNAWQPRPYQQHAWDYLERGGKLALIFGHRRWGKDDLALHRTAQAMYERVGNYWHMLPEQSQARKAIWNAVNPHSGKRRIDEAFPLELRSRTLDNEMLIEMDNGSIWQVVGSDNYNSLVGSPPIGLIASEWALAKPQAWGYLRPILAENNGWAAFITTPRGKNHAYTMYQYARNDPAWYTEVSPASATDVFTRTQLDGIRHEYVGTYGEGVGLALYKQEYECSFDAAVVGAVFGDDIERARGDERIGEFPYRRELPVFTFWDLGFGDETAIWFAQWVGEYIHLIDYYENNNKDIAHYVGVLNSKGYAYQCDYLPHDGASGNIQVGKSVEDLMVDMQRNVRIVPRSRDKRDSINSLHSVFTRLRIDEKKCNKGLEALTSYRWDYNVELGVSSRQPVHDWSSHAADALQVLGMAAREVDSTMGSGWERGKINYPNVRYI
jgi:hypothetical protein